MAFIINLSYVADSAFFLKYIFDYIVAFFIGKVATQVEKHFWMKIYYADYKENSVIRAPPHNVLYSVPLP